MSNDNYLVISDLQIPFQADGALEFCLKIKKSLKIPDDNILCVGDELDEYWGSRFLKNPDMQWSAVGEIDAARKILREWYKAFPKVKLANSNHGMRWAKKAVEAQIPSQMIRHYQEILEAPSGWVWKDEWRFKTEWPFRMIHGMGYGGIMGHRNAAYDAGMSTVIGHLHAHAGINFINTGNRVFWGFNVGSLIDDKQLAFEYGKDSRNKSINGCGAILENGRIPLFIQFGDGA